MNFYRGDVIGSSPVYVMLLVFLSLFRGTLQQYPTDFCGKFLLTNKRLFMVIFLADKTQNWQHVKYGNFACI